MDVLNTWGGRNGLDSAYFSFVPAIAYAPTAAVAVGVGRKKKKSKYANAETQKLAEKFPEQNNSADQYTILQQLLAESRATLEQRNKSKGKKRAELTGKLRAYDEYIQDYQKTLSELKIKESLGSTEKPVSIKEVPNLTKEVGAGENEETTTEGQMSQGTPSVPSSMKLGKMTTETPPTSDQTTAPTGGKKTNTLLFVGLGLAVVLFLVIRKK